MFNLVVSCVKSKKYEGFSIKNAITNLLHNGINDDVEQLFEEWKQILVHHMKSLSLLPQAQYLYKGAMWNASIEAFNKINEPRQLWIMSCGFGFVNSEEKISGYKATFKSGENDSLYNSNYFQKLKKIEVKKQWWNLLTEKGVIDTDNAISIHELVNKSKQNDVVLITAGSDYYEAIFDDLNKINATEQLPKLALVGIKKLNGKYKPSIPKNLQSFIQPYSDGAKLKKFLKEKYGKCSKIQVHLKSALYIIEQYNKTGKLQYTFP